jgi:hypothetical protein
LRLSGRGDELGDIVVQAPGAAIENCEVFIINPNRTKGVLFAA